jgi:hypothetical protein
MTTLDDAFEPLDRAADHADEPGSDQEKWQPILPVPDDAPALPQALIDRCAPVGSRRLAMLVLPRRRGTLGRTRHPI